LCRGNRTRTYKCLDCLAARKLTEGIATSFSANSSISTLRLAIGTQIARRDEQEIGRAKQLVLPVVSKQNMPKMYVLMDGVHVPVVAAETEGRTGRIEGQRARTRECKIGCVFTQTTLDPEGRPIRDPGSTTYVGAIETAEEFSLRRYTEAWRRGWEWATLKVVLGDGAVWIWNLADQHFPGAIQIVDLYHARQHLWKIAALLHPQDAVAKKTLDDSHEGTVGRG